MLAGSSSGTAAGWWLCGTRARAPSSTSSWGTRYLDRDSSGEGGSCGLSPTF